jgi:hypothetical protein
MSLLLAVWLSFFNGPRSEQDPTTNAYRVADSWSSNYVSYLQRIVTGSDAGNAKLRQSFDLPYVTTTPPVELVINEADCKNAVAALNSFYADSLSHSPVFLIRVGTTRFAISDRWEDMHIFDTSYHYKISLLELD